MVREEGAWGASCHGNVTELSLAFSFFSKNSVLIAELRCGLQAWTVEVRVEPVLGNAGRQVTHLSNRGSRGSFCLQTILPNPAEGREALNSEYAKSTLDPVSSPCGFFVHFACLGEVFRRLYSLNSSCCCGVGRTRA